MSSKLERETTITSWQRENDSSGGLGNSTIRYELFQIVERLYSCDIGIKNRTPSVALNLLGAKF